MSPKSRGIVATVVLMLLGIPLAFVLTLLLFPFWTWLEARTGIEAAGLSGPDAWCYWMVYFLMLLACAIGAWRAIAKAGDIGGTDA
jgi:hypothetical protein